MDKGTACPLFEKKMTDFLYGMENFVRKNKRYVLSVLWLLLIVLFTYTPLVSAGLKVDVVFADTYCRNQYDWIAMFVNFGLLLMVVFDYWGTGKRPTTVLWAWSIVASAIVMAIFAHTGMYVRKELTAYVHPFSDYRLSYILHLAFFGILLYIKIKSMDNGLPEDDLTVKAEF